LTRQVLTLTPELIYEYTSRLAPSPGLLRHAGRLLNPAEKILIRDASRKRRRNASVKRR